MQIFCFLCQHWFRSYKYFSIVCFACFDRSEYGTNSHSSHKLWDTHRARFNENQMENEFIRLIHARIRMCSIKIEHTHSVCVQTKHFILLADWIVVLLMFVFLNSLPLRKVEYYIEFFVHHLQRKLLSKVFPLSVWMFSQPLTVVFAAPQTNKKEFNLNGRNSLKCAYCSQELHLNIAIYKKISGSWLFNIGLHFICFLDKFL